MATTIGLLNQKGGVGKTTLSVNIAAELARRGNKVLLVDADPQGSSLAWAQAREPAPLFPVVGMPLTTLHRDLEAIRKDYDFVVIDGAPRVSQLSRSAIMASDIILIPVQPSPYDIWAADEIVKLVQESQIYKPGIKFAFVINRRIVSTAIGRDVLDALATFEGVDTLSAQVAQRVVFAESAAQGLAVFEKEIKPVATVEIAGVVDEILSMLKRSAE